MPPPSSFDIGNFPQPHSPSPQAVEPGVLPNLEASTAQSSEIQPTPPGVLITGSDTDYQHEAYILKLEEELREAKAELEKKDKELKTLNEK